MNIQANAAACARLGLAAVLVGAVTPILERQTGDPRWATLSVIAFRGGVFFFLVGLAMRYGWMSAKAADDAQPGDAAGAASLRD